MATIYCLKLRAYPRIHFKLLSLTIITLWSLLNFSQNASAQCVDGCGDISALNCSDVVVNLPYDLYFTGFEGGLQDQNGVQTGFTMVQAHSEARLPEDGNPSCAAIIGYEPSRLLVFENDFSITANKGIAFLDPPSSARNNTQINTMGVGVQVQNQKFEIKTKILSVNTGTGSAQAGIWYGLDEDNFVKLVVANNNTVELRLEEAGASPTAVTRTISGLSLTDKDVSLRIELDFSGASKRVRGFFQVENGSEASVGSEIVVPTALGDGISLDTGVDNVSFAGLFATYRNGAEFVANFDQFDIHLVDDADLFFSLDLVNESLQESSSKTYSLDISSSDFTTPTVNLTALYQGATPSWLTIGGNTLDGTVTHNTLDPNITFELNATGLPVGTYEAIVIAEAAGYNEAHYILSLIVNEIGGVELADFQMNFQNQFETPPDGWLVDFGQQYGARTGSNQGLNQTYGWVREDNGVTPLSMIIQGRDRNNPAGDVTQATFIHMQPGSADNGVWEIVVPNGAYEVTVSVGDGGGFTDSEHAINVEGIEIIPPTVPNANEFISGTATVNVSDGKLTMDARGGNNTKVNSIIVTPAPGAQRPFIVGTNILAGATDVSTSASISTSQVSLPNGGLDNNTIDNTTVTLTKVIGNELIPATVNGTGGGDAITLVPSSPLSPNTLYEFEISDQVLDITGETMIPYIIQFTTGNVTTPVDPEIAAVSFTKVDLGADATGMYTTLTIGPDDKLYAASVEGEIKRFPINPDGTLGAVELLTPFGGDRKLLIGLEFDPSATSDNLIAWISYSDTPEFEAGDPGPAWDGNIARLTGANLENLEIVVSDLPRSVRDHLVNSLEFGPDGSLYFPIAGNSAMGLADANWGDREERLLSAAVLRLDVTNLPGTLPLNARTPDGGGSYNPFAANAPLTIYATGVRNAYDLVWHSNGKLYAPANGSAAGGNAPTSDPTSPFYIAPNPNIIYTGPDTIPAAFNIEPTQPDWLYRVEPGGYYGHPNPIRAEYIVGRGDFEIDNPVYDGIKPDPNFREASFSFGPNKSPNGIIEYQSNAFGGALQGNLMVVRYSQNDDIIILEPGGANQDIIAFFEDPTGDQGLRGFADPLDLIEDTNTGNIYVSEFASGGKITLLQADVPATSVGVLSIDQSRIIDNGVVGGVEPTQSITFQNTGSADLIINNIEVTGVNAGEFQLSNLPVFPFTLAPNATSSIDVAFAPTLAGVSLAEVTFTTNNPTSPTSQVALRALGMNGLGEDNEPSLQVVMDIFEIDITVGDEDTSNPNFQITPPLQLTSRLGDEVFISQFQKASSEPVTIEVLASFANIMFNPVCVAGFYDVDNPSNKTDLFTISNNPVKNGQGFNPPLVGTTSFNPEFNEPFGFFSRWTAFSNREVFSEDYLNTFNPSMLHHVRVYPLRDVDGNDVANAYILVYEAWNVEYDYQDLVMIVRNVEPFDDPTPPSLSFNPGTKELSLETGSNTISSIDLEIINTSPSAVSVTLTALDDTTGAAPTWLSLVDNTFGTPFTYDPGDTDIIINVDASSLAAGSYSATITATSPDGLETATGKISLTVLPSDSQFEELRVNFQNETTTPPSGWLVDFGQAYGLRSGTNQGNGLSYGWISPSDDSPLNLVGNGRNRDAGAIGENLINSTLMHMQYTGFTNGVPAEGAWEIAVPNGFYDVTVTVGDVNSIDSRHTIHVEEDTLIEDFIPTDANRLTSATTSVLVTDGRLTIDPVGGDNTKITSAVIQATPTNLSFAQNRIEVDLDFGDNMDTVAVNLSTNVGAGTGLSLNQSVGSNWLTLPENLILGDQEFILDSRGLNPGVYRAIVRAQALDYVPAELEIILRVNSLGMSFSSDTLVFDLRQGEVSAPQSVDLISSLGIPDVELSVPAGDAWVILPANPGTGTLEISTNAGGLAPSKTYQTTVSAMANGYQIARLTVLLNVIESPTSFTWKKLINFQPSTSPTPSGYIPDFGEAFGDRGNFDGEDLVFGWKSLAFNEAFSIEEQMRYRSDIAVSLEDQTLGQMQVTDNEAFWEINLPKNLYRVGVSVGDPKFKDNINVVNAEGTELINYDQIALNSRNTEFVNQRRLVEDGRLTLDPVGGSNTKINYVWIGEIEASKDNNAPVIELSFDGIEISPNTFRGGVSVTAETYDIGNAGIKRFAFRTDTTASFVDYTGGLRFDTPGVYTLQFISRDNQENLAVAPIYIFEVVDAPLNNTIMVLENRDAFPENDELSFSRVQIPWQNVDNPDTPFNSNNDLVTLRVHNNGSGNLRIDQLIISNNEYWRIRSIDGLDFDEASSLPLFIAPESASDILVEFIAVDPPGARNGLINVLHESLTIYSNDDTEPIKEVKLHGLWQLEGEDIREPNINEIIDAFGLTTVTGFVRTKLGSDSTVTGDEIYTKTFIRADTTQPVYVRQLSAYHGCCLDSDFERLRYQINDPYTNKGGTAITFQFQEDGQRILPRSNNRVGNGIFGTPAEGSFTDNGPFNFTIRNDCTNPDLNFPTEGDPSSLGFIGTRIWKLRNSKGEVVPNTYLIANDYLSATANFDYNDNLYLIRNVRPEFGTNYVAELATGNGIDNDIAEKQSDLPFADTEVGTTATITLNLRNLGQSFPDGSVDPDIQLLDFEIVGPDLVDFGVGSPSDNLISPGEMVTVPVTFHPSEEGLKSASLLVYYDNDDSPRRIPLYGIATSTCYDYALLHQIKMAAVNGDSVEINGVKWESDLAYRVSGNNYKLDDVDDFETDIAATDRDSLYRSYMSSGNDLQAISYRFPLSDGRYTVRLHFVEKFFSLVNRRVNDILLEGEVRTTALDVFREVGQDAAYFLDYEVEITDGRLDLRINPAANRPAIAGIEIYQFTPANGISLEATQIVESECGSENGSLTLNLVGDTNPVYRIGQYGAFQTSGLFENLAPGTYKVYAQGDAGCLIFADFVVGSEDSPINFTVQTNDISCNSFNDGSATISGITGGVSPYSVMWNNNPLTTGNIVGNLIESDAHFVTVTDSLGCSRTVFFEIDREEDCPVLINVGGNNYLSQSGELFFEDEYFQNGRASLRSETVALTTDDVLYQSYRFATGGQDLNYSIPLTTGLYDVTLFFQEIADNLPGDRQFDIDMESTTVESNFDIVGEIGGQFSAIEKEYTVAVTDGRLNIDLKRGNTPILSAIKVEESGKPSNDAPYLANPIPDQETTIFINFAYAFPENTFMDPDISSGDSLIYTASLKDGSPLPDWMSFDGATRTFSGIPGSADASLLPIKVTATDLQGESVSDIFNLNIISDIIVFVDQNDFPLLPGALDKVILRIRIDRDTNDVARSFTFRTTGSSDVNDILRARLFYTGNDSTFNMTTELGSPIDKPNGEFVFTGFSQNLIDGDNYFWLSFDVEALAQIGNFLDAELLTVLIDDLLYTPGVIGDPVGARLIKLPDCGAFTGIGSQGTGGYGEVVAGLDIPGEFTVEAWMYPRQDTEERWILGETDGMYIFQNRNVYEFYIYDGTTFVGPATAPVGLNNWNHIAAVFDDAGDQLRLYVNGRLGTPFTYAGGANVDGTGAFVIGANSATGPFNDMILDELKVWSKAKTQTEIRRGFRIIAQTSEEQLIHYWQFNEAIGVQAVDLINEKVIELNGNVWEDATESVGCGVVGVPSITKDGSLSTNKSFSTTYTWLGTLSDISLGFNDPLANIPDQTGDFLAFEIFGSPATPPGGFDVPGSYWVIENFDATRTTFQPMSVQFDLKSAEVRSNKASDYRLNKRLSGGGNTWSIMNNSPTADPFVLVTVDTTADFANFAGQVGNTSLTTLSGSNDFFLTSVFDPLPISLLSFIGVRENENEVRLIWETASELNNKGFEIEKSLDARNFASIGYLDGAGNSSGLRTYNFLDNDARSSAYYRLKQVDFDGEFTYSPIVFVEGSVQDFINIYPNPVQDFIELDASEFIRQQESLGLQVISTDGRILLDELGSFEKVSKVLKENISRLAAGMYIIRVISPSEVYIKSIIKN